MPFQQPTGLADGLGLESAPGSLWIPKPPVTGIRLPATLGSPAPRLNGRGLGGHITDNASTAIGRVNTGTGRVGISPAIIIGYAQETRCHAAIAEPAGGASTAPRGG